MNKISIDWLKFILTVVKYGVTLLLGYLGGSNELL